MNNMTDASDVLGIGLKKRLGITAMGRIMTGGRVGPGKMELNMYIL